MSLAQSPPCATTPTGLVSWWRGEGTGADQLGGNNGTLIGNTTFGPGEVGQGFVFDGSGDAVDVGNPANLQLQDMTIEAWIKRSSTSRSSQDPYPYGNIFSCTWGGYALGMHDDGRIFLAKVGYGGVFSTNRITDTNTFHHVAASKSSSTVTLYIDGMAESVGPFDPGFVFNGPSAIGARGQDYVDSFYGSIDEVSIYNRGLTTAEVQSIYNAASAGKCVPSPIAPFIVTQPTNQTVIAGSSASFSVVAGGTAPLSYQWEFNGTNIAGATATILSLSNVQSNQAGNYGVLVSNEVTSVLSSNVLLTVVPAPTNCVPPLAGLVSWWRGESNTLDQVGGSNGTLIGNTAFSPGEVGQGFVIDGSGDAVDVGNPANLQLQDMTIEGWIKRSSASRSSQDPYPYGNIFSCTWGGYALGIYDDGRIFLAKVGYGGVFSTNRITDTNTFHHVAASKSSSTVTLYIDGMAESVGPFDPGFVFNGPSAIGARGLDYVDSFYGAIDEVSIYNRGLTTAEVQTIFAAGSAGKCVPPPTAPFIVTQPTNQTVIVGGSASFSVVAGGTAPLSYQWQFNGTDIAGATATILSLSNVQSNQAGSYSVLVSNEVTSVLSSNALLAVVAAPTNCVPPAAGLAGWWRGQGDATDVVQGNNGNLIGGTGFGAGEVGQAFSFNGAAQYVEVPSTASLNPSNAITLEAWVNPASNPPGGVFIVAGKDNVSSTRQYLLVVLPSGNRLVARPNIGTPTTLAYFDGGTTVPLNTWTHLAMTYDGSSLKLYVNGNLDGSMALSGPILVSSEPFRIGGLPTGPWYFNGLVDEVSLYNRALSAGEVQTIFAAGSAGKCVPSVAPNIITQPSAQTVVVGGTASFMVVVAGTKPLTYQWNFNGTNIAGATSSSLVISNAQLSDAGSYAIAVTNSAGFATSTVAALTVTLPPANVGVQNTTSMGGAALVVPVVLVANGDENAVGFSLNFDPSQLTYTNTVLGSGATNATLLVNSGPAASGKIGVAVALPTGDTFNVGTQEVVEISFIASTETNNISTAITFGDSPIGRQVSDSPGNELPAVYTGGIVTLTATDFEADVSPRPNGNRAVTITDWVLIGRFAAQLDYPTNGSEFQRADCAPRSSLGNGAITISDWVQAGRYAAGLDPLTPVGGPTSVVAVASVAPRTRNPRQVIASSGLLMEGLPGTVTVSLQALGNENALGFSLLFDPTNLSYSGVVLGSAAKWATLNLNTNEINLGRIGFALALASGNSFPVGLDELLKVTFKASATAAGDFSVGFGDDPIYREVADPTAETLLADYLSGTITINPPPSLRIQHADSNVVLAWPTWATNFVLQQADAGYPTSLTWSNLSINPAITNNERRVTLQVGGATRFYRLIQP